MIRYEEFVAHVAEVRARIDAACVAAGRAPGSVTLLPVTKSHPVDAALYAQRTGFPAVGENRVQEAAEKRPHVPAGLRWELIGHLQSNKAKLAVATFDRIQSVDSPDLAKRLDRLAGESGKTLPVLLQANAGADPAKFDHDGDGAPGGGLPAAPTDDPAAMTAVQAKAWLDANGISYKSTARVAELRELVATSQAILSGKAAILES